MASQETQQLMSDSKSKSGSDKDNLPSVLIHRTPTFNLPLKDYFSSHFHLLDPLEHARDQPVHAFLLSRAQSVRALLCVGYAPVTSQTLSLLPSLELVVATSAGVDQIDLQECKRRGIIVTNASLAFAEDAADYAVALLIDVLRRIPAADRFVRAGSWPDKGDYPLGFKLSGKRVGIVGLGSIGSEIAKRLVAFGCSIGYNSRKKKPSVPFTYYASVSNLAAASDVLILCCSLTEETRHVVNKDVMTALGKEGVVINVGRGALIDEAELVHFLVEGKIGGAGLDVFEDEPHVPKELFAMDNVVLSPHIAVLTPESMEAVQTLSFENLKAFFSNEPLKSLVWID